MKKHFTLPVGFLIALVSMCSLHADDLMQNGGFELPVVKQRTPMDQGGDPAKGGAKSKWAGASVTSATPGEVVAGLTNELSHAASQSFFIQFNNVSQSYQTAALQTALIPVQPDSSYRIGLWGRVDKKNPLVLGDRPAYLKLQIIFFKADGVTPVGDPEFRVQPIPGGKNRDPLFTADKWNEFYTLIQSSEESAFISVNVKFETGSNPGKTNGILYVDDFTINGPAADLKDAAGKPATPAGSDGTPDVTGSKQ